MDKKEYKKWYICEIYIFNILIKINNYLMNMNLLLCMIWIYMVHFI